MKNILIIGSDTMPGHVIYLYLRQKTGFSLSHYWLKEDLFGDGEKLDLFLPASIKELTSRHNDTVFINTLSILIQESKSRFEKAIYINSYFPNYLSYLLRNTDNKFLHISTDCVFNGTQGSYREYSIPDADDNYGKSKILGEVYGENDLTLRTSKIGPCYRSLSEELLDWFLKQEGTIRGYKNALWNGVSSLELAKSIHKAIDLNLKGLYNLAPFEKISKYDLLNILNEVFRKNLTIEPDYEVKVDKSLVDTRKEIRSEHKNYFEMFSELESFMREHFKLYSHYNWNSSILHKSNYYTR